MTGEWETKTVGFSLEEEWPGLDEKIAEHCIDGWEPWAWVKGGVTWVISFKRKQPTEWEKIIDGGPDHSPV